MWRWGMRRTYRFRRVACRALREQPGSKGNEHAGNSGDEHDVIASADRLSGRRWSAGNEGDTHHYELDAWLDLSAILCRHEETTPYEVVSGCPCLPGWRTLRTGVMKLDATDYSSGAPGASDAPRTFRVRRATSAEQDMVNTLNASIKCRPCAHLTNQVSCNRYSSHKG
jgi:hypothetical protein